MTGLIGEGAGVCGTAPLTTNQNQHFNFATDPLGSKAFQTMRARAALAGFSLFEASSGFLLCRHDMTVAAPCLRCVGDVLRRVGGPI